MKTTDLLQEIKPYVLGWIETGGGGEGGYAPSPHELDGAHHIGTLTTSQYPDALLRDGSRSITGNLTVAVGITVDGVDISVLKSDYDSHVLNANAHHNQVTFDANADAVFSLSFQQIGLDTQAANRVFAGPTSGGAAVPTFRALVAADIPALGGTPALTLTTSNVAGSATTYIRTDASLAIFDATVPTTIQPDDAAAAGSAAYTARRDHKHAIVCAAPSVVLGTAAAEGSSTSFLRADCTIVAFDATVPTTIQPDDAAAAGSAAYTARRDHKHEIVCAAPGASSVSLDASAEGAATSFARSDHTHSLSQAITPTWTGLHTFNAGIDLAGTLEFQGAQSITSTSGDLTIAPAGDLKLNPTGAQIRVMASHTLQADNYASQTTGWGISYAGGGDFRYLFADELHVKSFIADLEQALAGGQIISKSVAMLSRAFTAPAAGATQTLYMWDLPSAEDMAVFETGDIVRLRTFSRASGSLTVADCWGVVTSYSNLSDKEQSWTFTRSAAPNAGAMAATTVVAADSLALDYGTTGNGFYEVNAIDGAYAENSPYSQIVTWATHPATGQTVRVRLGNLFGVTAETEYGLFAGDGVTAGDSYIRLTDQNFELHNIDFAMYDSGNVQRIGMDAGAGATDKLMWAGVSESAPGFVVYGDGKVWLSTLAISEQMGDMLFSQANGLLLLGPGCAITPTSWTGTRGQVATLSGAFNQVQGPWANSKALVVEPAATNLETNPVIRNWDSTRPTGWTVVNSPTCAQSTSFVLYDLYSCEITNPSTILDRGIYKDFSGLTPGASVTVTVYVRSTVAGARLIVWDGGGWDNAVIVATTVPGLQRLQTVKVVPAGGAIRVGLFAYTAGMVAYFDGIQVEATAYASTFVWGGAGTGYTWNGDGTPHANTSTRAATVAALDAHASILSGRNTVTHSVWVQAQYNANDANWPEPTHECYIFDLRGADDSNRVRVHYEPNTNDRWSVYLNGANRIEVNTQTFLAGDWLHLVITLDYTNDIYRLYQNGVLIGSATTALTAPTGLIEWKLGVPHMGLALRYGGWRYGEYAVLGRVLTAEEVAGLYAQGKPLADMGAFRRPGIYVLDGEFDLRSSQTGARVQIDVTGVGGYSAATTKTFSLETDGDFFAGSDISAAGTTAFAVFATAQTYNSESMGAGDVLFGDNSAGKINLLWDVSEGDVALRRGTSARITLDGSADSILIGQAAASQNNVLISGGAISVRNNVTERIGLTAAGILTIKDSGGNAVFTFNSSAGAEFTLPLTLATTGGIYQGTGSFASPTTGLKIWNDGGVGRIGGYNSSTIQWYGNTDGKLYAGAGGVSMDANGFNVFSDTAYAAGKAINFFDGSTRVGEIHLRSLGTPLFTNWMEIGTQPIASRNSQIRLRASAPTSYVGQVSLEVDINGGAGMQPYLRLLNGAAYETLETNSVIQMFNSTAAPSTSVTNGVLLYAQDVSSSSELRVRDEAGNVTTLSPHNFGLIPGGPSEPLAWAYYGSRDGIAINVDMLKLARLMERLSGQKLVYISEIQEEL